MHKATGAAACSVPKAPCGYIVHMWPKLSTCKPLRAPSINYIPTWTLRGLFSWEEPDLPSACSHGTRWRLSIFARQAPCQTFVSCLQLVLEMLRQSRAAFPDDIPNKGIGSCLCCCWLSVSSSLCRLLLLTFFLISLILLPCLFPWSFWQKARFASITIRCTWLRY